MPFECDLAHVHRCAFGGHAIQGQAEEGPDRGLRETCRRRSSGGASRERAPGEERKYEENLRPAISRGERRGIYRAPPASSPSLCFWHFSPGNSLVTRSTGSSGCRDTNRGRAGVGRRNTGVIWMGVGREKSATSQTLEDSRPRTRELLYSGLISPVDPRLRVICIGEVKDFEGLPGDW